LHDIKNITMTECQFRHEKKYLIRQDERRVLMECVQALLSKDRHTNRQNFYQIRSLYFDDIDNSCFFDNENGVNIRKKYRIRYYNQDTTFIRLECKYKVNAMTCKKSELLTKEEAGMLIAGEEFALSPARKLLNQFYVDRKVSMLSPVIITDYIRYPFVYEMGNVRITFDDMLSTSAHVGAFLEGDYDTRPVFPIGTSLLEVKFDQFLPDLVRDNMEMGDLRQTAFSKYCFCRKIHE